MKNLTIILLLLTSHAQSQTWQTYSITNFSNIPNLKWENGNPYTAKKQHFKINHFDNSIWGVSNKHVMRIDNNGDFKLWNDTNTNVFQSGDEYTDIAFMPNKTFLVSNFTGLYDFNGLTWGLTSGMSDGLNLHTDEDTLWLSRLNGNYAKYYNSMMTFGSIPVRRSVSKAGETYMSTSVVNGGLLKLNEPSYSIYNSSSNPYYLDNQNYDFKFSAYSDTFFTSGDRGISIAVNGVFIDTITKHNTVNMPDLSIIEFEFDNQSNIWALFAQPANGAIMYPPQKLGYLNRTTNIWSQIYDGSNSPINYTRATIELDTNGNLWVASYGFLHVLNIGTIPAWLGNEEVKNNGTFVNIYPNPSSGKINLSSNISIGEIIVFDALGKEVLKSTSIDEIILPKGLFIVQVISESGEIYRETVVVE